MARLGERLSAAFVARVTKPGRYNDGHGLFLQVGKSGAKSWIFQFRDHGRRPQLGLGPTHTVSLAEARRKALELRKARLDGANLLVERHKAKKPIAALTFKDCAAQYIAAHRAAWKGDSNEHQWAASLSSYAFPILGRMPVRDVDVGAVMRCLEAIWRDKPETASRVRQRIEAILDWATVRGHRSGDNPARWRGHLENLLPSPRKVRAREHHKALPIDEVPAFLAALRARRAVSARALEFLLLTATRMGEVTGARWEEIDFRQRLWVIPGPRMKEGREHRIPLSPVAVTLLERMAGLQHSGFVFPGRNPDAPLKKSAMRDLIQHMGYGSHTSVHGLRSSFRDWAGERTSFAPEIIEASLSHAVGTQVERAYRRGDFLERRRRLMTDWAASCEGLAFVSGEVVAIGAAGQ
jgi:integrase